MSLSKKFLIITSLLLCLISSGIQTTQALTFTEVVNLIQAPDINLPTGVINPKGNIGFILSNLFWGTADGTKNGKIKPEYLDYSGISAWTQSGVVTYLTVSTGSVGIGTLNPGGYTTAIRGSNDIAGSGALWVSGFSATTPGLMVRNDGNVGIGTASPGFPFEVQKSVPTNWISRIYNTDTTGGFGLLVRSDNSGTPTATFGVYANNAYRLWVQSDGNVGIGTTSPASKLHIIHSGSITEDQSTALTDVGIGLRIQNVTAGQVGIGTKNSVGGPYEGDFIVYNQWFNGAQYVWKERMRVRSDGNVGIGTTNPYGKLDVVGSGDTKINLGDNTDANRGIILKSGTSVNLVSSVTTNSVNRELALGVNEIEYMRIRNNGNVGIGTSAPGTRLNVRQSSNTVTGGLGVENVGGVRGFYFWVDDANRGRIDVASDGSNPLSIGSGGGSVGIGVLSPSYRLHVNGTAAGTSWTNLSDKRFKKNITPISFALAMVDKLQGVNFDWRVGEFKDRDFPTGKQIGFIAQEVEKVLPEVVTTDRDGYKGVEYSNITAVLVEAVKELKTENDTLKKKNIFLEKKFNDLRYLICLDHPKAEICR